MAAIERIDTIPRGGKCVGQDPRIWYPHADKSQPGKFSENYKIAREHTALAIKICLDCPIRIECLSYALYHEAFGIWGGATERERKTIRRRLNINLVPKEPSIFAGRG